MPSIIQRRHSRPHSFSKSRISPTTEGGKSSIRLSDERPEIVRANGLRRNLLCEERGVRSELVFTVFFPITGAVIVATLTVVDVATDVIYHGVHHRRGLAARQALASIDRTERYHAVRSHLLTSTSEVQTSVAF